MSLSWLPWPTRRLHTAVQSETTWGYVIYRTTYTPESDTAFPRVVDLLDSYIKHGLYSECTSSQNNTSRHTDPTPYHEIWARHNSVIMNDRAKFNGASADTIQTHFKSWSRVQEKQGNSTAYRMCMVIDERSLQGLLNFPPPGEDSDEKQIHPIQYVTVIETSSDSDDEYDSFMGG
ncbi:uncharacterized protein N7482_005702 [Penicillium canariense]|uniref:Uncharacterized protein n=1 Tax=Penicillium canariense TaxID=189055 RepID=A0A9W9I4F7_9EURO|nr:uncharacterized protein N7482_005702 [Penicillium canariense]KAJ5166921.1 hypothetical protein N7482_005702 [Penicillium canariense]